MTKPDDPRDLPAAKKELRRAARAQVAGMSQSERLAADAAISDRLETLFESLGASFVVGYLSLPDECRPEQFLKAAAARVPVLVPIVARRGELSLGRWRPGLELVADREGVPSPAVEEEVPEGKGLVVVPGRVFDTEGGRLGRGLGYYDRFLAKRRGAWVIVGAAYECQVTERVPCEAHDMRVNLLVTESGLRDFRGNLAGPERNEEQ